MEFGVAEIQTGNTYLKNGDAQAHSWGEVLGQMRQQEILDSADVKLAYTKTDTISINWLQLPEIFSSSFHENAVAGNEPRSCAENAAQREHATLIETTYQLQAFSSQFPA